MKLALLSNVNMEPMKTFFPQAVFTGFNQYMKELLTQELIQAETPETVWLHLDARELAGDRFHAIPGEEGVLEEQTREWVGLLAQCARDFPTTTFLVSNLVFPPDNHAGLLAPAPFTELENRLNALLAQEIQEQPNVLVLDVRQRVFLRHGFEQIMDERFWYLGRIPYAQKGFEALAREVNQLLDAHRGKQKKVLVLDLDNTLWGGVVGEEGPLGVDLSEDGMGKAFRDFQKEIKAQKGMGALLALCSKNNRDDAMEVFKKNPMMVLRPEDFSTMEINWEPKAVNIQNMAQTLNLGLDAFVFIDDNPVERELVKTTLPQVTVPEFPKDPTALPTWFLESVVYPHFAKRHLTAEDRKKTEQYQKNAQRNTLAQSLDMESFIQNLDIKLTFHINPEEQVRRLAQMTQKTNQFNLTTRRYTEADLRRFVQSPDFHVFSLEYEDKFGKEGVIAHAIARMEGETARLDTFLLSCRVIGRQVEDRFFLDILKALPPEINTIAGEYIPTPKNGMTAEFYPGQGLSPAGDQVFTGTVAALINTLDRKSE